MCCVTEEMCASEAGRGLIPNSSITGVKKFDKNLGWQVVYSAGLNKIFDTFDCQAFLHRILVSFMPSYFGA